MLLAMEQGEKARAIDEVPVGAILVCDEKILAVGFNRRETSCRTASHAEMEALEFFNRDQKTWRLPPGSSVFVTVEPGMMCTGALLAARVDHIYYGAPDTKHAALRRLAPLIEQGIFDHRFKSVKGGILEKECAEQISSYFRKKRSNS